MQNPHSRPIHEVNDAQMGHLAVAPVRLLLEISDLDLDLGRGSVQDTDAVTQARSVRAEPSSRRNTAKSTLIAKSSATDDLPYVIRTVCIVVRTR